MTGDGGNNRRADDDGKHAGRARSRGADCSRSRTGITRQFLCVICANYRATTIDT